MSTSRSPHWILTAFLSLSMVLPLWAKPGKDKFNYEPSEPATESKNLFRNAKVTASGHWDKYKPQWAVNGNRGANDYWACEGIPCWLQVELKAPAKLNSIRLTPYWSGRYYQFKIEGSLDGKSWKMLVDARKNTKNFGPTGKLFTFKPTKVKFVRTTFTKNSAGNQSGGHIVEIEGFAINAAQAKAMAAANEAWGNVSDGLHGATATIDQRYKRNEVPAIDEKTKDFSVVAWQGERVNGQFVVWSKAPANQLRFAVSSLVGPNGATLPADAVEANFVRYILAHNKLTADVLDTAPELDMAAKQARPIWLRVNVPQTAKPGTYKGTLTVRAAGMEPVTFNLNVEVLNATLPKPKDWKFHLDLWQHPWAVATQHQVEPWSKGHWQALKPILEMLANAGQKCLTVTINDRPWNQQTFDAYGTMIQWIKQADGSWKYDYTLFDKYVEFAAKCGIDQQINCYSMVPWGYRFFYIDGTTGDRKSFAAHPGSKEYTEFWKPFLVDFAKHLEAKGWLAKTCIAMDERHLKDMKEVIKLVKAVSPKLKIALAANKELSSIQADVYDYCFAIRFNAKPSFINPRKAKGQRTTFYVCCGPRRPNTFPFSPPAESAWMGWYASSMGYDGFLRWAFAHWNRNPLTTTDYGTWPTGDCWFVYPGPRSSIRWERLREGIQDWEKLQIVRKALTARGDKESLAKIDKVLKKFRYPKIGSPAELTSNVNAAKQLLEDLSRKVAKPVVTLQK